MAEPGARTSRSGSAIGAGKVVTAALPSDARPTAGVSSGATPDAFRSLRGGGGGGAAPTGGSSVQARSREIDASLAGGWMEEVAEEDDEDAGRRPESTTVTVQRVAPVPELMRKVSSMDQVPAAVAQWEVQKAVAKGAMPKLSKCLSPFLRGALAGAGVAVEGVKIGELRAMVALNERAAAPKGEPTLPALEFPSVSAGIMAAVLWAGGVRGVCELHDTRVTTAMVLASIKGRSLREAAKAWLETSPAATTEELVNSVCALTQGDKPIAEALTYLQMMEGACTGKAKADKADAVAAPAVASGDDRRRPATGGPRGGYRGGKRGAGAYIAGSTAVSGGWPTHTAAPAPAAGGAGSASAGGKPAGEHLGASFARRAGTSRVPGASVTGWVAKAEAAEPAVKAALPKEAAWMAPNTSGTSLRWHVMLTASGSTAAPMAVSSALDTGNQNMPMVGEHVADRLIANGAEVVAVSVPYKGAFGDETKVATRKLRLRAGWHTRSDGVATLHGCDVEALVVDTSAMGVDLVFNDHRGREAPFATYTALRSGRAQYLLPPGATPYPGDAIMEVAAMDALPLLGTLMPVASARMEAAKKASAHGDKHFDQLQQPKAAVTVEEAIDGVDLSGLTPGNQERMRGMLHRFAHVINAGPTSDPKVVASLGMPAEVPVEVAGKRRLRNPSMGDAAVNRATTAEMLANNVVRKLHPGEAAHCCFAPTSVVHAQGKPPRMVLDLREQNRFAEPIAARTRGMEELLSRLQPGTLKLAADISKAYHTVGLGVSDQRWLAFTVDGVDYCYTRVPFGHCNAGAVFERLLAEHLPASLDAVVMIDDIALQAETQAALLDKFEGLLRGLSSMGACIGLHKLQVMPRVLSFLGQEIEEGERRMSDRRLQPLVEAVLPTKPKEWQRYLGVVDQLASVLPGAAKWTATLRPLATGSAAATLNPTQREAFEALREAAKHPQGLGLYEPGVPVHAYTDACDTGIGVWFSQNGRVLKLAQRAFSSYELSLSTVEKEALGMAYTLQKGRYYWLNSPGVLFTDAKNLAVLDDALQPKLQRIATQLMEFPHLRIRHIDGVRNGLADALSRMPVAVVGAVGPPDVADTLLARIAAAQRATSEAERRELFDGKPMLQLVRRGESVFELDGRVVVPPAAADLQAELLKRAHDDSGHLGPRRTYQRLLDCGVWWPQMRAIARRYVEECTTCARVKAPHGPARNAELRPFPLPPRPFHTVSADYMPLPMSADGNDQVLVIADELSGWLQAYPSNAATGENSVRGLGEWSKRWGLPVVVRTDNGSHFSNSIVADFCARNGIDHHRGAPYAPWTMARNERSHKEVKRKLQALVVGKTKYWDRELDNAVTLYNDSVNESMGCSPFAAVHGFVRRDALAAEVDDDAGGGLEKRDDWAALRAAFQDRVRAMQVDAAQARKERYDKAAKPVTYAVGDHVLLYRPDRGDSLGFHYAGLARVETVLAARNTCVVRDVNLGTTKEAHFNNMRKVSMGRTSEEAELAWDVPDAYLVVDKILEHKTAEDGQLLFKVQWQADRYLDWSASWEPAGGLRKIAAFQRYVRDNGILLPKPGKAKAGTTARKARR